MKIFWVADLTARGDVRSKEQYGYADLERIPLALDLMIAFSTELWRTPDVFERVLPYGLLLRWRSTSESTGICTLRGHDQLHSLSLLLAGTDRDADHLTLDALQGHLLRELHDSGFEPSFDLSRIEERPLVASIHLSAPQEPGGQQVFALCDRCFAASLFRKLGLA